MDGFIYQRPTSPSGQPILLYKLRLFSAKAIDPGSLEEFYSGRLFRAEMRPAWLLTGIS
jgi:hypothetical protein